MTTALSLFFLFFPTNTNNNANSLSTYNYQNSPVHAPKTISQTGPIIEVENLRLLSTNATLKIFGFHIKNNGIQNISNINFTFFTGVSQINSTIPINLTSQESIFVYLAYNYSNSTDYKITARAGNLTLWSQQSLAIGQNTSRNSSNLTQAFVYDANGNLVTDGIYYYEYNSFNQMSKIRERNSTGPILSEYLYDSDGNRIRKLDRIKNETVFYFNPNFLRVINATGTYDTIYYYADSQLIARKDPDGRKYFYHPDHLGSTTLVTNESGAVVEDTNYKPFGEPLYDAKSRFLYTGKEQDSESGLMYYGARYYSPVIGRFIQPDPIMESSYKPQVMNRYSYVLNNPFSYVDPTGKEALKAGLQFAFLFSPTRTVVSYGFGVIITHDELTNEYQIGHYSDKEGGAFLGGGGGGKVDLKVSYSSDSKNLNDVAGEYVNTELELALGRSASIGASYPMSISDSARKNPSNPSITVSGGFGIEAALGVKLTGSKTEIVPWFKGLFKNNNARKNQATITSITTIEGLGNEPSQYQSGSISGYNLNAVNQQISQGETRPVSPSNSYGNLNNRAGPMGYKDIFSYYDYYHWK